MKKFALFFIVAMTSLTASETKSIGNPQDTNFPKDAEGRVYHLGLKKGEIANRILLVGDPDRAKLIVQCLDNPADTFTYASNRGFTTYTGTKNGVPVTIMAIGMGMPMMDFAVREIRAITEGPLFLIRLGSCGTPSQDIPIGTLVVAEDSYGITTDYDAYHAGKNALPFKFTHTLAADPSLHNKLVEALIGNSVPVVTARDATTDSFYGSQGRLDDNFDDRNDSLMDRMLAEHPHTGSLQMETYHLFHLAKLNEYAKGSMIRVAACAIVLAQRKSNDFLSNERKHVLEEKAGNACLEALSAS